MWISGGRRGGDTGDGSGRVDELGEILCREEGKVLAEAKGEIRKGISVLEYYAGAGCRLEGRTIPAEARSSSRPSRTARWIWSLSS